MLLTLPTLPEHCTSFARAAASSSTSCPATTKRRHVVERDGLRVAIDKHLDGSLVAEIDGGDVAPADPPTWLDVISEVTDDEAWTGGALAQ